MSEAKHTPGKWEIDLETGEITGVNGQVSLGYLHCFDCFPCLDPDDPDEGVQQFQEEFKANAALIAAAPDLLAIGYKLSGYAAAINWDGSRNTKEWLVGLEELIDQFQAKAEEAMVKPYTMQVETGLKGES